MTKSKPLSKNDEFTELRETLILPHIQKVARDLEEEGWYCVVGNLNPFSGEGDSLPQRKGSSCFTSLSIVDIEHRLVQYVYVFIQNESIRIMGDENCKVRELDIELTRADEELDGAIRKVIDLGV